MAILSAKNKRMGKAAIFFFGLAVLVAMVIRLFRSGAKTGGEYLTNVKSEIKSLTSLQMFLLAASAGVATFSYFFESNAGMVLSVALGTLTTGAAAVTTFNTTYLPKWFSFTAATQLTGVKITVQGDGVVFDSDAAGLTSVGTNRQFGQITNTYLFTISNGFISGKNVIWEFTNSAAQTPVVYVSSDETPALTSNAINPKPKIDKAIIENLIKSPASIFTALAISPGVLAPDLNTRTIIAINTINPKKKTAVFPILLFFAVSNAIRCFIYKVVFSKIRFYF